MSRKIARNPKRPGNRGGDCPACIVPALGERRHAGPMAVIASRLGRSPHQAMSKDRAENERAPPVCWEKALVCGADFLDRALQSL